VISLTTDANERWVLPVHRIIDVHDRTPGSSVTVVKVAGTKDRASGYNYVPVLETPDEVWRRIQVALDTPTPKKD
jgi:hypothetical protein